jgi:protocatechuate 3,4-dioxygenase beta subunit
MIITAGINTLNVQMVAVAVAGILSGVVTNSATGAALSGVTVTLGGVTVTTDAGGHYTFTSIPPGTYIVTFSRSGYVTKTF